jgi:excisionase family DNA binding protein
MGTRVTIEEAATILGRSSSTLRRWERDGRIRGERRLGRLFFERADVERIGREPLVPAATEGRRRGRR